MYYHNDTNRDIKLTLRTQVYLVFRSNITAPIITHVPVTAGVQLQILLPLSRVTLTSGIENLAIYVVRLEKPDPLWHSWLCIAGRSYRKGICYFDISRQSQAQVNLQGLERRGGNRLKGVLVPIRNSL